MTVDSKDNSNNGSNDVRNSCGSLWHRWDPHIHIPGTLHSDRFQGERRIDEYIERVNDASPRVRALGITDYYILDSYKQALEWRRDGRLPGVAVLFPNIELRFAVNVDKGSPINFHLLVSPEDADHIELAERFLNELTFKYEDETYHCTRSDIMRLGRAHKPDANNCRHALKIGSEQFKVDPDELTSAFEQSAWARHNILMAIAASSRDGTAQVPVEGGLAATRKKLERAATIIFSSKEVDPKFWLGHIKIDRAKLDAEYGGAKPCLHGSDAHDLDTVCQPALKRYCWLKGDLTFETLRQACIEPEGRAFIGEEPPKGGLPSNTITRIAVSDADWLAASEVPINPGLVAVIGARGSGKTALVELIAAGARSIDKSQSKGSFLTRARDLLGSGISTLTWRGGDPTSSKIDITLISEEPDAPRVRYLSQQFVDRLCSSDGLADELVTEIERVIFQTHTPDTRLGASSFSELRETMTAATRRAKERYKATLTGIADELSVQRDLDRSVGQLEKKRADLDAAIKRDQQDRKQLTPSENKPALDRLEAVRGAAEKASHGIAGLNKRHLDLSGLKQEADQFRDVDADTKLRQLKSEYPDSGLSDEDWGRFKLTYHGDIDAFLDDQIKGVLANIAVKRGPAEGEATEEEEPAITHPYFPEDADLSGQTLSLLQKEQRRLEAIIGVDVARRKKYTELCDKIAKAETQLKKLNEEIVEAKAAKTKIKQLVGQREKTYGSIFGEIVAEETLLQSLYKPLEDNLKAQEGALNKLTFSVRRQVDLEGWTEAGESFLDVRKVGEFRGKGAFHEKAEQLLADVWRNGDPAKIAETMSNFRATYGSELWKHIPDHANRSRETRKAWSDKVSAWLFSTDHIEVTYGLQYEGIDIQRLSPGTRGIVLLLLYLSIDQEDDRPLIIDQPEENLDPQSIYFELVERFKEAKTRRQIIIVTHNANLVVNTDADQVIVASRGEHRQGKLPILTYHSGGLENPAIRKAVCEILEGGEVAFTERARRLRIALPPI
jgi:hypothetical protein